MHSYAMWVRLAVLVILSLLILVVIKRQDEEEPRRQDMLATRAVSLAPMFKQRLAHLHEVCQAEEVMEVADNKSRRWMKDIALNS